MSTLGPRSKTRNAFAGAVKPAPPPGQEGVPVRRSSTVAAAREKAECPET